MYLVQRVHDLQLDQAHLPEQQVHAVLADRYAVIDDCNAALLHDGESRLAQFIGQSILTYLPQQSAAERIEHGKCTADDVSRQSILPISICVHLRASACIFYLS